MIQPINKNKYENMAEKVAGSVKSRDITFIENNIVSGTLGNVRNVLFRIISQRKKIYQYNSIPVGVIAFGVIISGRCFNLAYQLDFVQPSPA